MNPNKKRPNDKHAQADQKNLIIAVVLSAVLVVLWQVLIEGPKRAELAKWNVTNQQKIEQQQKAVEASKPPTPTREEAVGNSPRVAIHSAKLDGSIALKGLRFDDLKLVRYRETQDANSEEVTLLSPSRTDHAYIMQAGWLPVGEMYANAMPGPNSVWQANQRELKPGKPVTFSWNNGMGLTFYVVVALDEHYMFTLTQRVENHTSAAASVIPYAYINRSYVDQSSIHYAILHEGPIGVLEGALNEISYQTLREEEPKQFKNTGGWLGITDKYWLTALIPGQPSVDAKMYSYKGERGEDRYQTEFTAPAVSVPASGTAESSLRLFAGAKEINVLDAYAKGAADLGIAPIMLFDRSVDFGVLYFLTKPLFLLLNIFFFHTGNFGIAIILLTIVVKGLMFPLANKGYKAATQMRALQPEMKALREKHGQDKMRMQQELIALYKREKVNPAAGCFPILVQIPVFFALYKVLFVTIEMRHAPFYSWLRDLSAPDPSNIFTLFGLFPWDAPPMFHIGVLPILMGVSMGIQMRQQPKPPDPVQAKVIGMMPYFLTFVLASMPAGLVLYWTWSNILSILQQSVITRRYNKAHPDHPAK